MHSRCATPRGSCEIGYGRLHRRAHERGESSDETLGDKRKPDVGVADEEEATCGERLGQRNDDQDASSVVTVGDRPTDGRSKERRKRERNEQQRHKQSGISDILHQSSECNEREPITHVRQVLRNEQNAKVAVGAQDVRQYQRADSFPTRERTAAASSTMRRTSSPAGINSLMAPTPCPAG